MLRWATCSSSGAALALAATLTASHAKVFLSQEEALRLAFPGGAEFARETAFLTDEEARAVEKDCSGPLDSKIITYYVAGGPAQGPTAYFDTHIVRTLPETIMIVVTPEGTIGRIDILSFSEPQDYLLKERWMAQLPGRGLDEELSLRRGVRPMTGATLSARAIVDSARRILSVHRTLAARKRGAGGAP